MIPALPAAFLTTPLAHRAYHDVTDGRPENSRAAIRAAVRAGNGVEIDLQLTSDGAAVVFHDYDLGRLTPERGPIRQRSLRNTAQIPLLHSDGETIPSLTEVLDIVNGAVPLLIELKDQDGAMGPNVGALEAATIAALEGYGGPVAVMSFNPNSVAKLGQLAPGICRGLTTEDYPPENWPFSKAICARLRDIPDFDTVGAAFISHKATDLDRPRVAELKARGVPILCWTIRSPEQEAEARKVADNVTFDGYAAAIPS